MVALAPGRELEVAREVVRIARAAMKSRGFALNCKPCKTTAMMALHGPGGDNLKELTYGRGMIADLDTGLQALLTHTYKHLGTMVSADVQLAPGAA